jgi:hypothetical protein
MNREYRGLLRAGRLRKALLASIKPAMKNQAHATDAEPHGSPRRQLTVYLRLNEEKVPTIYGPSADEGK